MSVSLLIVIESVCTEMVETAGLNASSLLSPNKKTGPTRMVTVTSRVNPEIANNIWF